MLARAFAAAFFLRAATCEVAIAIYAASSLNFGVDEELAYKGTSFFYVIRQSNFTQAMPRCARELFVSLR